MKSLAPTLLAGLLVVIASSETVAGPGDPRVLRGVLAWSPGAEGAAFLVVRGDDGRHYVADVSAAQRRGTVNVGDRLSLVGVEGPHPWEMSAIVMGAGDSALAALSTPADVPAASPAMTPRRVAPAERATAAERAWRRIHGNVESVGDGTLRLREADGRSVTVDMSRLIGNAWRTVRPGAGATVFVVAEADQRLVAVGFVQADGAGGSAAPRRPR